MLQCHVGSREMSVVRNSSHEVAPCQKMSRHRSPPPYFATRREKLDHGIKSMICENSVRPKFTMALPIGKGPKGYGKRHFEFKSTPNKIGVNSLNKGGNSGSHPRSTGRQ